MTRPWSGMLFWTLAQLLVVAHGTAATGACAATPSAAVLASLGLGETPVATVAGDGFRVRDIVTDPLLHRAFVHVEQCSHPERPLVLLPFAFGHVQSPAIGGATSPAGRETPRGDAGMVLSGTAVVVAMGGEHVRLSVQGRLLGSAAVGSEVDVQLATLADGPDLPGGTLKRVHGRLTAADRVEVQP